MGTELLEALECLKSWLKIKEFDLDGVDDQGIASRQGSGDSDSKVNNTKSSDGDSEVNNGCSYIGSLGVSDAN